MTVAPSSNATANDRPINPGWERDESAGWNEVAMCFRRDEESGNHEQTTQRRMSVSRFCEQLRIAEPGANRMDGIRSLGPR